MTALPAGWSVENLGLIESVQFTHTDGRVLLWGDGEWRLGSKHGTFPMTSPQFAEAVAAASGIAAVTTMTEARRAGTAWLASVEPQYEADRG